MKRVALMLALFLPMLGFAQGTCHKDTLNGSAPSGYLRPVAGAVIRVCSDTLSPCTTVPIYSDAALTQPLSNPIQSDTNGNYSWCAAPGNYNEQMSGAFNTVNNTPVSIAGFGDVTKAGDNIFAGNNTHNGTETFAGAVTEFRGTVDASAMAGGDMCAKINAAWLYALAKGWKYADVDASRFHGRQDVAGSCFSSFPATGATPKIFIGRLKLAPDVIIVTAVTQNPPTSLIIDGGSAWVWPSTGTASFPTSVGAQFIPADGFNWATQKAVLTLGYSGGTTNPRGIWLQDLGVSCITPNGTYTSGSVGIYDGVSQENTGANNVSVVGCTKGVWVDGDGTFGGSQNAGPWDHMVIQGVGVPASETNWVGFDYCSVSGACRQNRGIHYATITGPIGGAPGSVGVSVNSANFSVMDSTCEEMQYCVELSKYNAALGVTLSNINGEGHTDFNMEAVVHVPPATIASFTAQNISNSQHQRSDYTIKDEGTNGKSFCGQASTRAGSPCFGATLITPNLAFYSVSYQTGYGNNRVVFCSHIACENGAISIGGNATTATTASACPTCFAGETSPAAGQDYTIGPPDRFKTVIITPNSSAGNTATLPSTIPDGNWSVFIKNGSNRFPAFINPNGKNLEGATTNWLLPPQGSVQITTQGTSYHANPGWGSNSLILQPAPLSFSQTTSTGDQTIACRVSGGLCPAGMYRISVHVTVTAAGSAGTMQPYCGYKDASGTIHNPLNVTAIGLATTSITTIGNSYAGECVIETDGSSNPKYGVTLSGATGTPTIRVNASAERISIQ